MHKLKEEKGERLAAYDMYIPVALQSDQSADEQWARRCPTCADLGRDLKHLAD